MDTKAPGGAVTLPFCSMIPDSLNALAIDTSSDVLSLALIGKGQLSGSVYLHCGPRMNSLLFDEIDGLLQGAGLGIAELHLLIAARGPGSFTGTRLGLGVAQTFSRFGQVPLIGVDTLQLLARQTDSSLAGTFHTALNCTRDEVYHAPFRWEGGELACLAPMVLEPVAEFSARIDGAPVVLRRFPRRAAALPGIEAAFAGLKQVPLAHPEPDGGCLLAAGLASYAKNPKGPHPPALPIYLKAEAFRTWKGNP